MRSYVGLVLRRGNRTSLKLVQRLVFFARVCSASGGSQAPVEVPFINHAGTSSAKTNASSRLLAPSSSQVNDLGESSSVIIGPRARSAIDFPKLLLGLIDVHQPVNRVFILDLDDPVRGDIALPVIGAGKLGSSEIDDVFLRAGLLVYPPSFSLPMGCSWCISFA